MTVVIPCFNQAEFLPECLRSIQAQDLPDWEVVVVDDASSDADPAALVARAADPRVRLVRHEVNRGQGAARNTGLSHARAPLVLPVDADDRLHPEYLSATLAAIREGKGADCAFTEWQLFGSEDEVWRWEGPYGFPTLLSRQTIPGPGTLMTKKLWERAGGYSEDKLLIGNEDWDFWIAATATGVHPAHVARPLYLYRRHDASMSSTFLDKAAYFQQEIIYFRHRKVFDRFQEGGRFRASGYLRSAVHAWETGRRQRALALLSRGLATPGVSRPLARSMSGKVLSAAARRTRAWPAREET